MECNKCQEGGKLRLFKASCNISEIMRQTVADCPLLEVYGIGPWEVPRAKYAKAMSEAHLTRRDLQSKINQASLGFTVNYGGAQVLLGGDMESLNWNSLRKQWAEQRKEWKENNKRFPELKPNLVKVSHHGSETSCLPRMWGKNGFLVPKGRPPVAVVTPWNRASEDKRLPNSQVIKKIRRSGVRVFVTSSPESQSATNARKVPGMFTHLHLQLSTKGKVRVIDRGDSEELPPLC